MNDELNEKVKVYNKLTGLIASIPDWNECKARLKNFLNDPEIKENHFINIDQMELCDEDRENIFLIQSMISKIINLIRFNQLTNITDALEQYNQFFPGNKPFFLEFKKYSDAFLVSKGINFENFFDSKKNTSIKPPQAPDKIKAPSTASTEITPVADQVKQSEIVQFVISELSFTGNVRVELAEFSSILRLKIYTDNRSMAIGRDRLTIKNITIKIKEKYLYKQVKSLVIQNGRKEKPEEIHFLNINTRKVINPCTKTYPLRSKSLKALKEFSAQVKDFTNFTKNAPYINIYIDESWPGLNNPQKNISEGVIGGIVWIGNKTDEKILPRARTHMRGNPAIITDLMKCPHAMPFIMPINVPSGSAMRYYLELVEAAIKILLGWLLPQSGTVCSVNIYLENIQDFSNIDKTDHFTGIIKQAKEQSKSRFSRFIINTVKWMEKEFEYISYGDILGYLALEHNDFSISSGTAIDYKNLYGYVPLSLDMFNVLNRLDLIEEIYNTEDIFTLIDMIPGTKILDLIIRDIDRRAQNNSEIRFRILKSLEYKYQQKERDLQKLRAYFNCLHPLFSDLEKDAGTQIRLLLTLLKLQKANHDGNPGAADISLEDYRGLSKKAIANGELDLAMEADLNLAVHFNDMFMFDRALKNNEHNLKAEYYRYLKPSYRAKILSSLGQSYALLKDHGAAENCFSEAIEIFRASEDKLKELDIEQTSVYRLFNALESDSEDFDQLFRRLFPESEILAKRYASSPVIIDQYKHHLFLRTVYEMQGYDELKKIYLQHKDKWTLKPFHPWELIALYRGLLQYDTDPEESYIRFIEALEICRLSDHGETLSLIGAVIGAVGVLLFDDESGRLKNETEMFIKNTGNMTETKQRIFKQVNDILADPEEYTEDDVLALLPFYYK